MKRAITGVHELVGDANLNAARGRARHAYFRLAIGKMIARA
jgi:hypothetical protein